jgi:signal transduction histidine kinase
MKRRVPVARWWVDLPIRYKGLLVVTLPIVTLVTAILIRIPFTRMQEENTALLSRASDARNEAKDLLVALLDIETGVRGYTLTRQEVFLEPYETGRLAARERVESLARLSTTAEEQAEIDKASTLVVRVIDNAAQMIALVHSGVAPTAPEMQQRIDDDRRAMGAIRDALSALHGKQDTLVLTSQQELVALRLRLRPFVVLTLVLGLIGVVPAGWLFATGIAQRVKALERNAERLARGERLRKEPSRGRDEIGSLDLTLRRAALLLRSRDRELRTVNRHLERTLHEQELLNRELEAFSYSVSHDLRAPLRSIDGFAQALREDWGDRLDEAGQSHLARVRNAAQRMGRLIDDLLKLARLTRSQIQRSEVDLSQYVRDIAVELAERNPTRKVEWVIADGLRAWCDPVLTRVVLENLVGNAWKFTSKTADARIEFFAVANSNPAVFVVRDNGAGFDMRYVEKLFSPFQRLHGDREFPGTGVGLATVQRIVQKHGGAVETTAEVGKGATFSFTLMPRSEAVAVA